MSIHKTKAGTELPLLKLQGKDYLTVPYRVLWMREEHPDWSIETEFLKLESNIAIAKATIRDASGKIIAQGTKSETPEGFRDYIEKSESGAVGRALGFCGYGTQFAQELDEGERIVDSPLHKPVKAPETAPEATSKANPPDPRTTNDFISPAQLKRLYAIQKQSGMPDDSMKQVAMSMGITTRTKIPRNYYEALCKSVENWKSQ